MTCDPRSVGFRRGVALTLSYLVFSYPAMADQIVLPAGTVVYVETQERVSSKKGDTFEGDLIEAIVWRDVRANRNVVIEAGTPVVVKVSKLKRAKMAGVKGQIELRAFSATSKDGTLVPLIGGYDKSGRGRMGLSITLGVLFIVPILIKGKQAVLEPGTVFDAQIQANTELQIASTPRRVIHIGGGPNLTVEVLYDEIPEEGNVKVLPLRLELCGEKGDIASIVAVNEKEIEAIPVHLAQTKREGNCLSALGNVDLKQIGEHFTRGINRFNVKFGDQVTEVILEIEL